MTDLRLGQEWRDIGSAPSMHCLLMSHPYHTHGRFRHGYCDRNGQWRGVNANGTEGGAELLA
jgi:hypothetical protein